MSFFPFVTVIMPIRNEAGFITDSLNTLLEQDYPPNRLEILVADGLSTDATQTIVNKMARESQRYEIKLINNFGKIVPIGINTALRCAKGEIIVRIDGHTHISPDYVTRCVETLQRTDADNAGGRMDAIGITPFGKTIAIATSTPFGIGGSKFHYSEKEEWVDSVYMGAWPREVFEKYGLFDEELVRDQDDEFNYRIRENGGKILLSPLIKSEYTVRSTPSSLWKQYYQYGYWKIRVLQKHPRQMSLRQFVPPTFDISLFAGLILSISLSWGWILLTFVIGSYIIANLAASIYTANKKGWEHFLRLPLVFAILHISYGFGFLVGLVKFWNRWRDKKGKVPAWGNV